MRWPRLRMRRPARGAIARITTSESKRSPDWRGRDLASRPSRRAEGALGVSITDEHAALLGLFSKHLPRIHWDEDEHAAYIVCSCGNHLYAGHLIRPILAATTGQGKP